MAASTFALAVSIPACAVAIEEETALAEASAEDTLLLITLTFAPALFALIMALVQRGYNEPQHIIDFINEINQGLYQVETTA